MSSGNLFGGPAKDLPIQLGNLVKISDETRAMKLKVIVETNRTLTIGNDSSKLLGSEMFNLEDRCRKRKVDFCYISNLVINRWGYPSNNNLVNHNQ